jgi:hypothetical protein
LELPEVECSRVPRAFRKYWNSMSQELPVRLGRKNAQRLPVHSRRDGGEC